MVLPSTEAIHVEFQKSAPREELVDVVDAADTVIGRATKTEIFTKNLNHRTIQIMLLNQANEIALQKRGDEWTASAFGIVLNNETYRQAATRIIKEQLGISPEIQFSGKILYKDPRGCTVFMGVFAAPHSGPFRIDANLMDEVRFFPRDVIDQTAREGSGLHPQLSFVMKS